MTQLLVLQDDIQNKYKPADEDEKSALCTKCKNAWHPKYIDCDQAYAAKRDGHDKSNLVIELTTKKCPACDERISHYHGHGCHRK